MPDTEVSSRLTTSPQFDNDPPSLRVSWVAWDSGFRGSGIQIRDEIVAVNGIPVAKPADADLEKVTSKSIGQYAEAQSWSAAKPGDAVALTVHRRKADQGWETVTVKGTLLPDPVYTMADGGRALAPGGPDEMGYDDFESGWGTWYRDQLVPKFQSILDGGWQQVSFNNRIELASHLQQKARVDYLVQHYPGAFASAVQSDWQLVLDSLQGPKIELTDDDIKFRRAEDERVAQATAIAAKAYTDFCASLATQTIPAFPAIHPIRESSSAITGKYIIPPAIRNSDWLEQGGKTFFAFGSATDGFYFADAESPSSQAMLLALERYRLLVTPSIDESYQMVCRILPDPDLRVVSGVGYYGMQLEIVAAIVGGAMFVDVTQVQGTMAPFAGEEIFDMPMHALPPDAAAPQDVMAAFFGSLKTGDMKLWKALFADWYVDHLEDGRPLINPHAIRIDENLWEYGRQILLKKIYDLRVHWVGDPHTITSGTEFPNAPKIEEVDVEIDHIGLFDGEYRVFKDVTVNRMWSLQRVDGGPWRISTIQSV